MSRARSLRVARVAEYVYDQTWREERDRLRGMESLWDEGTRRAVERLGIEPGWRCLEVGAGAGSVAEWLAERVGPEGEVLATDVSTRYLEPLDRTNLEIREHDIRSDPLPEAHFDLIHARLVVEHLGRAALEPMVPALKPGGWLLLEDYDFGGAATHPEEAAMTAVTDAILGFMSKSGFDPLYGRRMLDELEAVGLEEAGAEGRSRVYRGGSPGTAFARLSLESLRGALVDEGLVTEEQVETALANVNDPANTFISPTLIAAWGRRPL